VTGFFSAENRITLVDSSNHTLLDVSPTGVNFLNYYEVCAPADQCLTLTFEDQFSDGQDGQGVVEIMLNGERVKRFGGNWKNHTSITKLGTCNDCSDGYGLFQLFIGMNEYEEEIIWRLSNRSNNTLLQSDTIDMRNSPYFYYDTCAPTDDCLTLTLEDLGMHNFSYMINCPWVDGVYEVIWNGIKVKPLSNKFGSYHEIQLGSCSSDEKDSTNL